MCFTNQSATQTPHSFESSLGQSAFRRGFWVSLCALATLVCLPQTGATAGVQLLQNGDFEALAILGSGQTQVGEGEMKLISTQPGGVLYDDNISGIADWNYITPLNAGTLSDHGLARRETEFGNPPGGQSAFINNYGRLMSQTFSPALQAGDTLTATIDFGTLGSDMDSGRAGDFLLVAGEVDPLDPDNFSSRSVILAELTVGNPSFSEFTPDVLVGNGVYTHLTLSYTYGVADPSLLLPVTLAFRTLYPSEGPTYWDNASLVYTPVAASTPEPTSLALVASAAVVGLMVGARRRRKTLGN